MNDPITIDFAHVSLTGVLTVVEGGYPNGEDALVLETDEGPETLSVNLKPYPETWVQTSQPKDEPRFFIKDYSEHAGLAEKLKEQGIVKITSVWTGPFNNTAYGVDLLI